MIIWGVTWQKQTLEWFGEGESEKIRRGKKRTHETREGEKKRSETSVFTFSKPEKGIKQAGTGVRDAPLGIGYTSAKRFFVFLFGFHLWHHKMMKVGYSFSLPPFVLFVYFSRFRFAWFSLLLLHSLALSPSSHNRRLALMSHVTSAYVTFLPWLLKVFFKLFANICFSSKLWMRESTSCSMKFWVRAPISLQIPFFFAYFLPTDGGVIGGCDYLCHFLPEKVIEVGCNLLCDFVGIKEFINIINQYVSLLFLPFCFSLPT